MHNRAYLRLIEAGCRHRTASRRWRSRSSRSSGALSGQVEREYAVRIHGDVPEGAYARLRQSSGNDERGSLAPTLRGEARTVGAGLTRSAPGASDADRTWPATALEPPAA